MKMILEIADLVIVKITGDVCKVIQQVDHDRYQVRSLIDNLSGVFELDELIYIPKGFK